MQKIGTNGQPAKVLKKSISWVNKMNIIGKDCINIVLPFQNQLRSPTSVSEKRVLPVAVFVVLLIYAIVAAIFYSEC